MSLCDCVIISGVVVMVLVRNSRFCYVFCGWVRHGPGRRWLDFGSNSESFLDCYPGFFATRRYSVRLHFTAYLSKLWVDFDVIWQMGGDWSRS